MFRSSSDVPHSQDTEGLVCPVQKDVLIKHKTIWKLPGAKEAIPEQRGWGAAPEPHVPAASLCPVLASLTPAVSAAITLFLLI